MTPAILNRVLRRRRRRFASLVIIAALAAAVSAHHLPSGEHGHMDAAEVVAMCMAAVLPFAVAALAVGGGFQTGRRFTLTLPWVPYRAPTSSPAPRARSSPVATVVLRR